MGDPRQDMSSVEERKGEWRRGQLMRKGFKMTEKIKHEKEMGYVWSSRKNKVTPKPNHSIT